MSTGVSTGDQNGLRFRGKRPKVSGVNNSGEEPHNDLGDDSFVSGLAQLEKILAPIIFTILSFGVRLYRIGLNASVVWDEAHFGKFGSYYLRHEFYHDVHPPLGKMLIGLFGYLAGYNGSWEFS